MAYDWPYRIEYMGVLGVGPRERTYWEVHGVEGKVCQGEDYMQLRRLVDAANAQLRLVGRDITLAADSAP